MPRGGALASGAAPDLTFYEGQTPLFVTAQFGHLPCLDLLLQRAERGPAAAAKADLNQVRGFNVSPGVWKQLIKKHSKLEI